MRRTWSASLRLVLKPPGLPFHLLLVLPALALLYSFSFPGFAFFMGTGSSLVLLIAASVWVVRAILFAVGRRRGHATGSALWFLVAPLCALVTMAFISVDAPLRLRWEASRRPFERVAHTMQEGNGAPMQRVPYGRVGLYRVLDVESVPGGVMFYEQTGLLFDHAGFAYLPQGPSPSLENGSFENPEFRSLGGGWYAWTASW